MIDFGWIKSSSSILNALSSSSSLRLAYGRLAWRILAAGCYTRIVVDYLYGMTLVALTSSITRLLGSSKKVAAYVTLSRDVSMALQRFLVPMKNFKG